MTWTCGLEGEGESGYVHGLNSDRIVNGADSVEWNIEWGAGWVNRGFLPLTL